MLIKIKKEKMIKQVVCQKQKRIGGKEKRPRLKRQQQPSKKISELII